MIPAAYAQITSTTKEAIGPLSGSLSDVRLYNRALNDTAVSTMFERPRV